MNDKRYCVVTQLSYNDYTDNNCYFFDTEEAAQEFCQRVRASGVSTSEVIDRDNLPF